MTKNNDCGETGNGIYRIHFYSATCVCIRDKNGNCFDRELGNFAKKCNCFDREYARSEREFD